jgi:hypothetical protein
LLRTDLSAVIAGLVPAIHVLCMESRGCPA